MVHSRVENLLACFVGLSTILAGAACVANPVVDDPLIRYELAGTLEEGGEFFGVFAIDPLAMDLSASVGYGSFNLRDVEIQLVNTSLFSSAGNTVTSGTATEALLIQSASGQRQSIAFTLLAKNGLSNVFTNLPFTPFTGDADIASPLEGVFVGGVFDGNGESPITSLSIARVPEPNTAAILCVSVMVACCCRRAAP